MNYKNGSLESLILNSLWELEKMGNYKNSVKEVFELINNSQSTNRAYTTIKTVMDRLHEKELLLRIKQGKKFFYRTATTSSDVIRISLEKIAHQYCDGDMIKLMRYTQNLCDNESALA